MILGKIREFLSGKGAAASPALKECENLLTAFLRECKEKNLGWWTVDLREIETGRGILNLSREEQALVVEAAVRQLISFDQKLTEFLAKSAHASEYRLSNVPGWKEIHDPRWQLKSLVETLLKKKLPLDDQQVGLLVTWCLKQTDLNVLFPIGGLISAVENLARDEPACPLGDDLLEGLRAILAKLQAGDVDQTIRKYIQRLQDLLGGGPRMPLQQGEVWSNYAIAEIANLPSEKQSAWIELLELCSQASGAKPSAKWSKQARLLIHERIGDASCRETVLPWFSLVDKPRPADMAHIGRHFTHPLTICDLHADILRGLVWACGSVASPEVNRALTALALSSYKKIPGIGPRLTKVGNACIGTLGQVGGLDAIGQMAILKVRVKFGTAQAMLEKALDAAAAKEGLPREELEEMSVPAYGLTEVGTVTLTLGESTAEVFVADKGSVQILWKNADGKTVKAPPALVKKEFGDDLKELRQMQKDIERMLSAQAARLDQLFLLQKSWPLGTWRERYLAHPLVGVLARRLIWNFQFDGSTTPAIWNDDRIEALGGAALDLPESATVSLWHPLDSPTPEIQAWRLRVESRQIQQPFKQAHREVYVLTPAEETTSVYSNRFASHFLKQHQFNALCGQRGWKNKLRLMVDDTYPPAHRNLPGWDLRAEYWIEGIGTNYGTDTNDSGVYLHLSTDQVRFYATGAPSREAHAGGGGYAPQWGQVDNPVPLHEIPPLVFSEIMRDVDLFVGVCSVGADPTWSDGGPQGRYRDYWRDYSFGELSGNAGTRRDILTRLVPKLKIAAKCSVSDRFLVVQGTLHEYKIHLGSGNILMSPNDQYLCIVARQSTDKGSGEVFLPFEGDQLLSVILSKAFLLANDTTITDPTIIQQIKR